MEKIPLRHIVENQRELGSSEKFTIQNVKDLLAGKSMIQELHRQDYFYVLALKRGKGTHEIDFTSVKVCDNSIFFMHPGQVHQLTLKSGSVGYLMHFKTDFYFPQNKVSHQLLRKASNKNFCQLDSTVFNKLFSILANIFQEYKSKQEGFQEIIKANLSIFLIELVRQQRNKKSSSNTVNSYRLERVEEFLELLENHIAKYKQVSYYADKLNLTPYQLNAMTKEMLGKTCSALINEYIILESRRYLLSTSNQVNQIAYNLGYEDISYFIRFFKKHTGYTPEAFRRNFR
jgi:AraC-like DNA-binding protein